MAKLPWFPFYPSDWLGSTKIALMRPEQRAAFIDLLCHAWADPNCSIPSSDDALALLTKTGQNWGVLKTEILVCFDPHPTIPCRLINSRLSKVRELKEVRYKAAVKGWRKQKRCKSDAKADAKPLLASGSGSIPPKEVNLYGLARAAKVPNNPNTIKRYIETWVSQTSIERVKEILQDPWTKHKTVIDIQRKFFDGGPNAGQGTPGVLRTGTFSLEPGELERRIRENSDRERNGGTLPGL